MKLSTACEPIQPTHGLIVLCCAVLWCAGCRGMTMPTSEHSVLSTVRHTPATRVKQANDALKVSCSASMATNRTHSSTL